MARIGLDSHIIGSNSRDTPIPDTVFKSLVMYKQKKYLNNEPLADAIQKYNDALRSANIGGPLPGESIAVYDSLGRVTSEAVIAKISSPFYHSAAMDGVAVRFIDTFGASETRPKRLRVPDQAVFIDTGDPMP